MANTTTVLINRQNDENKEKCQVMVTDFQVIVELITQTGLQRTKEKLKKMRKEAKLIKSVKDVSGHYYK